MNKLISLPLAIAAIFLTITVNNACKNRKQEDQKEVVATSYTRLDGRLLTVTNGN